VSVSVEAPVIGSDAEALEIARAYAAELAPGAIERDRERRLPVAELEALGRTGLLALGIPARLGGPGVRRATAVEAIRVIAAVDPAIGQVPQNHFQLVDAVVRWGTPAQQALLLGDVARGARFGNALSERGNRDALDIRTQLTRAEDGTLRLDGRKYYSTGALTAQWVPVLARLEENGIAFVYLPRDTAGLEIEHDWTAFGQRATVSGTTTLTAIEVDEAWVLPIDLRGEATTFNAFAQVIHAAVDVGIARGALEDAGRFLTTCSRPWFEAGVERAADEPHIQLRFGRLQTRVHAAEALLARAGDLLDAADADPSPDAITAARLGVAEAKAFGGEVALEVATDALELLGTSATDAEHGLDRHWRNARTHTLHDANRFKYVHVGRHLLDGVAPAADNWAI
jgi:SfnB family sulfur acquisition oxidoreductase